jgi:hypothetical protein
MEARRALERAKLAMKDEALDQGKEIAQDWIPQEMLYATRSGSSAVGNRGPRQIVQDGGNPKKGGQLMGADGTWQLLRREGWERNFPDVKPEDCGFGITKVLGIPVICRYRDTEGRDDLEWGKQCLAERVEQLEARLARLEEEGLEVRKVPISGRVDRKTDLMNAIAECEAKSEYPYSRRCLEAVRWFEANCEEHTVWT